MKTLDERMDLIAQRAQVIKEKRRRRRKTAAVIAGPLSLCLLLCCLWLPAGERTGDSAPANSASGGFSQTYDQVQIQSNGKTTTVTDMELVSQLHSCISQVEELQREDTALTVPDEEHKSTYTHIEICFVDADGLQVQYTLSGKALTNKTTGVVNILSSAQLMQLRNVLREMSYEK